MRSLYSGLTLLALCLGSPYFLYHAVRHGKYLAGLPQRFGRLPRDLAAGDGPAIWIHAVSVGEVLASRALVPDLRARYPGHRLVVSTTTATGQRVASELGVDGVFYFPLDVMFAIRRTLDHLRPALLLVMETELWPNLLRACRQRGVRTVLVNGRLSAGSYRGYRRLRPLVRPMLADLDRLCVQTEPLARRFVELGADPARVRVTGSVKFDVPDAGVSAPDPALAVFESARARPIVVAASTEPGEDAAVFEAFAVLRRRTPSALLIVAPRHPERFDAVHDAARAAGLTVRRRTSLTPGAALDADVVVLDTIGELARLYTVATVVFVGGSLVPLGGHNPIEAAVFGKPVVFGPYMDNFAEIADRFVEAGGAVRIAADAELGGVLAALLADPARRASLGGAARDLVEASRGARTRTLQTIAEVLPPPARHAVRRAEVG